MSEDALSSFSWAQHLTAPQRERVARTLVGKTVKRGGTVCRKGETANYWYGVRDGLVKMSAITAEGKPMSFIGLATGGWFGEGTLLKKEHRKYDIVALRDTRLDLVPASVFHWLVETSPPFAKWVMLQLNERLGQFIALLSSDRLRSSDVRIARTLGWLFNPYLYPGMPLDIPITQEEIAHLSGASRPRANAALHRLAEQGLLRVGYRHVVVIDVGRLREFDG